MSRPTGTQNAHTRDLGLENPLMRAEFFHRQGTKSAKDRQKAMVL